MAAQRYRLGGYEEAFGTALPARELVNAHAYNESVLCIARRMNDTPVKYLPIPVNLRALAIGYCYAMVRDIHKPHSITADQLASSFIEQLDSRVELPDK